MFHFVSKELYNCSSSSFFSLTPWEFFAFYRWRGKKVNTLTTIQSFTSICWSFFFLSFLSILFTYSFYTTYQYLWQSMIIFVVLHDLDSLSCLSIILSIPLWQVQYILLIWQILFYCDRWICILLYNHRVSHKTLFWILFQWIQVMT